MNIRLGIGKKLGVGALLLSGIMCAAVAKAQVNGGQFSFEFLRLANSPHVTAMGGIAIANPEDDITFALQNPSLMRRGLHNQLALGYNGMYAGISATNLAYGYHAQKVNTSFLFGVQYLNYGEFTSTTASGAVNGTFRANDYALSLGASRSYGQHWRYGATVKFAQSALAEQRASAAMVDVGINYYDTASLWDIAATAKNMGVMLDRYTADKPAEPIPFDLQIGISKRFKHVPLRLFTTIHHLYEWDIRYDNPDDAVTTILSTTDSNAKQKSNFSDKLFRHFIFGAEIKLGNRITVTGSYNYLRRKEMVVQTAPGIAGFAFGAGIALKKFDIHYGRSYYHVAGAYNEIGINFRLNRIMGLGELGEKINWNDDQPDWQ